MRGLLVLFSPAALSGVRSGSGCSGIGTASRWVSETIRSVPTNGGASHLLSSPACRSVSSSSSSPPCSVGVTGSTSSALLRPVRLPSTLSSSSSSSSSSSFSSSSLSAWLTASSHSPTALSRSHFQSTPLPFRIGGPSLGTRSLSSAATTASTTSAAATPSVIPAVLVPVRRWLFTINAMVFSIVVVGGYTRLTGSGLSMTRWSFAGGLPPRTREEWEEEFAAYKDSPEYQVVHKGMTVEEFKGIFWLEYIHRMIGRSIGVAFVVPFVYFAAKGIMPKWLVKRCSLITVMIGGQGLLGWYMVKSGLKDEFKPSSAAEIPKVSPYRLAAHLTSAFSIYLVTLWTALDLTFPRTPNAHPLMGRLRMLTHITSGLVCLTIVSGAFVAGTRAGRIYGTWPLMGSSFIPDNLWSLSPGWKNLFENLTTVQFDHRILAKLSLGLILFTGWTALKVPTLSGRTRTAVMAMVSLGVLQFTLGVLTLIMDVPMNLAASHQANSLALLSATMWVMHEVRRFK